MEDMIECCGLDWSDSGYVQVKSSCERGNERFEVFKEVTMKNDVFWDVAPCGSCENRRFGGTQRLRHQCDKNR
jgi:hypothetical protein